MLPAFMHLPLSTGYTLVNLLSCTPDTSPAVNMHFINNPPVYSHARSSAYLSTQKDGLLSSNYNGEFPITEGLTRSGITYRSHIKYMGTTLGTQACLAIQSVDLTITYSPMVYISSNISTGGCLWGQVMTHEQRHVSADMNSINEYLPTIRAATTGVVVHAQTAEPIDIASLKDVEDYAEQKLEKSINAILEELNNTRVYRQRQIDSRAEYMRISRACPGEKGY